MSRSNGQSKREWDLSGRKLKALPAELLEEGAQAKRVDLQRNRLKQVSGLSSLLCLKELNLSRNELLDFPLEVGSLSLLERLYLNQNNIRVVPEGLFPRLENLQFLKLSTNHLSQLPADLACCRSLAYLNLSHNSLTDLQPLVGLSGLTELHVEMNSVTQLPPGLFQNSKLKLFKFSGNPLRVPPEEVCVGGVRDIQNYFTLLFRDPDSNTTACTVKTMFLGSSMAGKSTLSRSLRAGAPVKVEEDDRTEGIEICELELEGVRLLFWDFAGQEEYYLTHHVFITPRALVILAVDLASYSVEDPQSFTEKVWFWINNIQLRVPDSVVLPVATHSDQCRSLEEVEEKRAHLDKKVREVLEKRRLVLTRQKKTLEERDPTQFSDQIMEMDRLMDRKLQVMKLITIACTRQEGIDALKAHLLKHIEQAFPCAERTLPQSYGDVEHTIHTLLEHQLIPRHGIVSLAELRDMILEKVEVSKESVSSILRYLHRIGLLVWYEEIPALAETVYAQPSILISLFKTVVRPDLAKQLQDLPRPLLLQEGVLALQRAAWVEALQGRGMLPNVATRILVLRELKRLGLDEDEDLVSEVVGSSREEGALLSMLQHFQVCLPTRLGSPLDPAAPEFVPGKAQWDSDRLRQREQDAACLFPNYLLDNREVEKAWGVDKQDDVRVHVYFLPEVPHGFFHRLTVNMCSLYPTHWVGRDQCLLCSWARRVLLRQNSQHEDQFIEIRCKRPEPTEFRQSWDMVLAVICKLWRMSQQWPGLVQQVYSPCPEAGCSVMFPWRDWQELVSDNADIYSIVPDEKVVCTNGHTRRTELLFPKVPGVSK
ncbi:malignant fibrous histiocytoma-amplified sequence 1 homolog [Osmerus eperlanus]|uniref:malignant fibrous histiocytoma-amplified sequence 1 homolog n=1 Tax=Osmerus eperlanus TaxID=29151 RepID=UPI002E164332